MNHSQSSSTASSEKRASESESESSSQSRYSPSSSSSSSQRAGSAVDMRPSRDMINYVRRYARQKPDVAALWCFGLGVIVGWKIKPW